MVVALLVTACTSLPPDAAPAGSTVAVAPTPDTTAAAPVESTPTVTNAASTIAPSATPACDSTAVGDIAYRSIEGVDPALLSVDVHPVEGRCDAPVAIWVHGGGWRRGDKDNDAGQRAAFYNAQGWLLVSVNYRLTTATADPPVRFPDHNNDVAAAIAWIDAHIDEFGGDRSTMLLVGHSAGAGIAAAVMADPSHLAAHGITPDHLDCVVLLDSAGYDVSAAAQGPGADIYVDAFGDDPAIWARASPIEHVGDGPLPARVLIVTRGGVARVDVARTFADRNIAEGTDAHVVDVSPLTHEEVNTAIGSGDDTMTPLIAEELQRCRT